MSVEAITWAFGQEAPSALAKYLLVALANSADTYGCTYVGQGLLAERCQCARETVSRNMAALESAGLITRVQRRRGNGSRTSDWTILAPGWPDRGAMLDAPPEEFPPHVAGCASQSCDAESRDAERGGHVTLTGGPEPSENRQEELSQTLSGEDGAQAAQEREQPASPRRPRNVNRKLVRNEEWIQVEEILARINLRLGTKFHAGQEDNSRMIVMRLRDHPEVTLARHLEMVDANAADPWWDDKPDSVGVIYSPKAFPRALRKEKAPPVRESTARRGVTATGGRYVDFGGFFDDDD